MPIFQSRMSLSLMICIASQNPRHRSRQWIAGTGRNTLPHRAIRLPNLLAGIAHASRTLALLLRYVELTLTSSSLFLPITAGGMTRIADCRFISPASMSTAQ